MTPPTVAIDLRQFFEHPLATGVQRVLLCMLEHWPDDVAEARVLGCAEGRLFYMSAEAAARCIRACFDYDGEYFGSNEGLKRVLAAQLEREVRSETRWPEALLMADRFLIAEPSLDTGRLRDWAEANRVMPTTMIFYDAMPQTNPEFFKPHEVAFASAYSRLAAGMPRVVSISPSAATVLIDRLRNPHPAAGQVALPGADHIPVSRSAAPRTPVFLVVSSVEKRKRFGVIVDAFLAAAEAVGTIELHIIGRRGSDGTLVEEAAGRHGRSRIRWFQDANDEALTAFASRSTALFSIGEEGYGLPAVEMLRRGCPVVFAGTQPAAQIAEGFGTLRLADASVESVAEAMIRLADPGEAAALRENIRIENLPTWQKFANDIARVSAAP